MSKVLLTALVVAPLLSVHGHDNGMDMSMDGPMNLMEGHMLPYLHFTKGDVLWFLGWVPTTAGSMVGACIGLFLLAIIERWISACRSLMEVHWRKRTQMLAADKLDTQPSRPASVASAASDPSMDAARAPARRAAPPRLSLRQAAPFVPAHDITRGIVHAGQSALGFAFMLAAMTFQASFILSICLGLGVGEALFGRYAAQAHLH